MRIISGTLKGKSINFLKNSDTRPLRDSVRESIFNILKHSNLIKINVENSNILDLYSGIGSFGIEALSRDAKRVTFVEKDINASNILRDNLIKLSLINKTRVFTEKIEHTLIDKLKEKFNIFFLDPPFVDINYSQNLELIKKNKIFQKDHIVIIHRERKSKDSLGDLLEIIEIKKYGKSKIIFGKFS
ncbi:16S rRNA (guanine(966)-N(2))-methyltransferase RsmD [Pelagibacteraceae bacterium]|nr:16S rRNA (guanine(966)-N(2))-methyltransferase RsmD [Pelagibacteraceae bacterium]